MSDYKMYANIILETISRIENSFAGIEKKDLLEDYELQDATLMRLQVIGENIKKIPSDIKKKNKE